MNSLIMQTVGYTHYIEAETAYITYSHVDVDIPYHFKSNERAEIQSNQSNKQVALKTYLELINEKHMNGGYHLSYQRAVYTLEKHGNDIQLAFELKYANYQPLNTHKIINYTFVDTTFYKLDECVVMDKL